MSFIESYAMHTICNLSNIKLYLQGYDDASKSELVSLVQNPDVSNSDGGKEKCWCHGLKLSEIESFYREWAF